MSNPPYSERDLKRTDAVRGRAVREGLAYWSQQLQKSKRLLQGAREDLDTLERSIQRDRHLLDVHRLSKARMRVEKWGKEKGASEKKIEEMKKLLESVWEQ